MLLHIECSTPPTDVVDTQRQLKFRVLRRSTQQRGYNPGVTLLLPATVVRATPICLTWLIPSLGLKSNTCFTDVMQEGQQNTTVRIDFAERLPRKSLQPFPPSGQSQHALDNCSYVQAVPN